MQKVSTDEVPCGHKCAVCQESPNLNENDRQWVIPHPDGKQHFLHFQCFEKHLKSDDKCPNCRASLTTTDPLKNLSSTENLSSTAILPNEPLPQTSPPQTFSKLPMAQAAIKYFREIEHISVTAGLVMAIYSLSTDQRIAGLQNLGISIAESALNLGPWLGSNFGFLINGTESSYNFKVIWNVLFTTGVVSKTIYPNIQWFIISLGVASIAQLVFNNMKKDDFEKTNKSLTQRLQPINQFLKNATRVYLIATAFSLPFFKSEELLPYVYELNKFLHTELGKGLEAMNDNNIKMLGN